MDYLCKACRDTGLHEVVEWVPGVGWVCKWVRCPHCYHAERKFSSKH
jgi:hypothetical protein